MICRQRLIVLFFLVEHMVLGGFHIDKVPEDQDCIGESVFPTALRFEAGYWAHTQTLNSAEQWQFDCCNLTQTSAKNPGKVLSVCGEEKTVWESATLCLLQLFILRNKQIKTSHIRQKMMHICNHSTWETEVMGWIILGHPRMHTCFINK